MLDQLLQFFIYYFWYCFNYQFTLCIIIRILNPAWQEYLQIWPYFSGFYVRIYGAAMTKKVEPDFLGKFKFPNVWRKIH